MVCRGLEGLKWAEDDVKGARDDGNGTRGLKMLENGLDMM